MTQACKHWNVTFNEVVRVIVVNPTRAPPARYLQSIFPNVSTRSSPMT